MEGCLDCFQLCATTMNKVAMNIHAQVFVWTHMSSFVLCKDPEVELLGHRANVYFALQNTAKESSKMAAPPFCNYFG